MKEFKLSRYIVPTESFLDQSDGLPKRLLFGTRKAELRVVPEEYWSWLKRTDLNQVPTKIVSDLVLAEFLVPQSEDELRTILARNAATSKNETTLYRVLHPTAWCQLGCRYCGQTHARRRLSEPRQQAILDRIHEKLSTKSTRRTLKICWFGAEPLAGLNVIRQLTPGLQRLATSHEVDYRAKMVTNGLALTHQIASELCGVLGVRHIEVTLDGTADFHDRRRQTKKGEPTFRRIYTNVRDLALRDDFEVELTIRCNVDFTNRAGVIPLIRRLAEDGLASRIAGFYCAPIHPWGNDADRGAPTKEEYAAWEIETFIEMIRLGFRVSLVPTRRPINCLLFMPDAEVIDADGMIFNCTETSYVSSYLRIPGVPSSNEYATGNLEDGELPRRRYRLETFYDRVSAGEFPCGSCRILPVCGGGCPKLWFEKCQPCPVAKFNVEERLLLHYARSRVERDDTFGRYQ